MDIPYWALSAAYWLHMLATVVWIGALSALALVVLPAASSSLEPPVFALLLEKVQQRLDPLAWLSLVVLIATGMFQMSSNPNYEGFLAVDNRWAAAILAKHITIGLMVIISAYITWGVLPALRRSTIRLQTGLDAPEAEQMRAREVRLMRLNLALGVVVLALTALARSV